MCVCASFYEEGYYATVGEATVKKLDPAQQSGPRTVSKNERWLKTQSAFVTSSRVVSSPKAPSPPLHHLPTSTRNTPIEDPTHNMTPDSTRGKELPTSPVQKGSKTMPDELSADYNTTADDRRLRAMNMTLRRPSEGESNSAKKLSLSKEALLLRSGVTLRPGVRPPSFPSDRDGEEWRGEGGRGGDESSGPSDEEDGLEPVSRYTY